MKRALLITLALSAGCATTQPEAFERRTRKFDVGEYIASASDQNKGSLFDGRSSLFQDERPRNVGDVVVVRIEEKDSALHDSSTDLSRSADVNVGITGSLTKLAPQAGLQEAFGFESGSNMSGNGRIVKKQEIRGVLPVRVKQVLPNGDLYVEGTKVVVVGDERRYLYVSGVVRSADILQDGSVLSSRLADADISYVTEGDAADQQRPGWLSKVLNIIWPF